MGRASDTERGSLLRQPIRRGCGSGRQPLARCRLAAHGAHGRPGPSPFQASRHLGASSPAQTLTDFRFWISPWSCSLSDGAAGLISALRDGRCSSWNTAAALCGTDNARSRDRWRLFPIEQRRPPERTVTQAWPLRRVHRWPCNHWWPRELMQDQPSEKSK
jgi:hypothetical protein